MGGDGPRNDDWTTIGIWLYLYVVVIVIITILGGMIVGVTYLARLMLP